MQTFRRAQPFSRRSRKRAWSWSPHGRKETDDPRRLPRPPSDRVCPPRDPQPLLNTSRKGTAAERLVHKDMTQKGWLVGSLGHTKGSWDHMAVMPTTGVGWLIETKAVPRKGRPYSSFSRAEREAMKATPIPPGWTRMLAVVKGSTPNMQVEYIAESAWP